MALSGKYAFVKDEGFENFLPKPDASDKPAPPKRGDFTLEIGVDGNNVTLTHTMGDGKTRKTEFEIGKEFEDKMGPNLQKSVGSFDGNILTVSSKSLEGTAAVTKTYIPSATGLEIIHKSSRGEGKTIFKRQ